MPPTPPPPFPPPTPSKPLALNFIYCSSPRITLRAVVSPVRTLRFDEKETTTSNRFLFHRSCASTWSLRISNDKTATKNFNKTIGWISTITTLHVHHAFIFAFLCHFCTTTTWRCLILRFMDNVNKQRRNLFFFSLLNLDMVSWNSTPFGFAYIWQSK